MQCGAGVDHGDGEQALGDGQQVGQQGHHQQAHVQAQGARETHRDELSHLRVVGPCRRDLGAEVAG